MARPKEPPCSGQFLLDLRGNRGWSQDKAASKAGICVNSIIAAEKGLGVSSKVRYALAKLYEVDVKKLLICSDASDLAKKFTEEFITYGREALGRYVDRIAPTMTVQGSGAREDLPFSFVDDTGFIAIRTYVNMWFKEFEEPHRFEILRTVASDKMAIVQCDGRLKKIGRKTSLPVGFDFTFLFEDKFIKRIYHNFDPHHLYRYIHGHYKR